MVGLQRVGRRRERDVVQRRLGRRVDHRHRAAQPLRHVRLRAGAVERHAERLRGHAEVDHVRDALVAGSITVTVWPGGFVSPARPARLLATYRRSPCGVRAVRDAGREVRHRDRPDLAQRRADGVGVHDVLAAAGGPRARAVGRHRDAVEDRLADPAPRVVADEGAAPARAQVEQVGRVRARGAAGDGEQLRRRPARAPRPAGPGSRSRGARCRTACRPASPSSPPRSAARSCRRVRRSARASAVASASARNRTVGNGSASSNGENPREDDRRGAPTVSRVRPARARAIVTRPMATASAPAAAPSATSRRPRRAALRHPARRGDGRRRRRAARARLRPLPELRRALRAACGRATSRAGSSPTTRPTSRRRRTRSRRPSRSS